MGTLTQVLHSDERRHGNWRVFSSQLVVIGERERGREKVRGKGMRGDRFE